MIEGDIGVGSVSAAYLPPMCAFGGNYYAVGIYFYWDTKRITATNARTMRAVSISTSLSSECTRRNAWVIRAGNHVVVRHVLAWTTATSTTPTSIELRLHWQDAESAVLPFVPPMDSRGMPISLTGAIANLIGTTSYGDFVVIHGPGVDGFLLYHRAQLIGTYSYNPLITLQNNQVTGGNGIVLMRGDNSANAYNGTSGELLVSGVEEYKDFGHSFAVKDTGHNWYVFRNGELLETGNCNSGIASNADGTRFVYMSIVDADITDPDNRNHTITFNVNDTNGNAFSLELAKYRLGLSSNGMSIVIVGPHQPTITSICGDYYFAVINNGRRLLDSSGDSINYSGEPFCCDDNIFSMWKYSNLSGAPYFCFKLVGDTWVDLNGILVSNVHDHVFPNINYISCCGKLLSGMQVTLSSMNQITFTRHWAAVDPSSLEVLAESNRQLNRDGGAVPCRCSASILAAYYGVYDAINKTRVFPEDDLILINTVGCCGSDIILYERDNQFEIAIISKDQGELTLPQTLPPSVHFNGSVNYCCGGRLIRSVSSTLNSISIITHLYVFDAVFGLMAFDLSTLERFDDMFSSV